MSDQIESAIKKAKELVEKMKLEEPYKSLTYTKLLDEFFSELKQYSQIPFKKSSESEESSIKSKIEYPTGIQGRILLLKDEDNFKEPKTVSNIQKLLGEKGFIYKYDDVGVALLRLVRKGFLRRVRQKKEGKEIFVYVKP